MPPTRKRARRVGAPAAKSSRRRRSRQRLIRWLGAAIIVLFGGLALLVWRDSAREAAGRFAALVRRTPATPTAPDHLGIAVAGLVDDAGGTYAALLRTTLGALPDVQIKTLAPPVTLGTDPSGLIHSKIDAPGLLASAAAAGLVWGQVTKTGGVAALQLYWTDDAGVAATHFDDADRTVPLPALDWDMLQPVLGMLAQSRIAALTEERTGRYPVEIVQPFIDKVRSLRDEFSATWSPDTAAGIDMAFAEVLRDAGARSSNDALLNESIAAYRDALTLRPHAEMPLAWAAAEDGMGLALAALGRGQVRPDNLEAALQAYQNALQERTRDHVPPLFAATEHNMAVAYWLLGRRSTGPARLAAAARADQEALSVLKQDEEPLEWAMVENDLGVADQSLAQRDSTPELLNQAIAAYRAALQERTETLVPLQWAATRNNLGAALELQAERSKDNDELKDAVADYQDALRERTRERVPLAWAETQHNLGNALTSLGDREDGTEHLLAAVAAYRSALLELTRDRTADAWATTQADLGIALTTLGQREKGPESLQQAVAAYAEALQVQTQTASPFAWATATGNQGVTMMLLADRTDNIAQAKAAMQQIQAALDVMRATRVASGATFYQAQLVKARALVDELSRPQ
ncbi:MAG TPA: hypothetical protein VGG99_01065 [Acetobacteraceae bacterium]|jgi:tetratricopeptide (TPR) repeat protein